MRKLGLILVEGLTRLLALLPLRVHYALSGILCFIAGDVLKYRRKVILENLEASFPDKSPEEIKKIMKGFYRHFADIFAEAVWFGGSESGRLHRQHICEAVNPEVINEAFANSPSVMVLTSHNGNWELRGGIFSYNYDENNPFLFGPNNLGIVYKKLKNEVWDEFFKRNRLHCIRKYRCDGFVESSEILRYALQHKNDKKVYVFSTDQYPYKGAAQIKVDDFLHQETYSMAGGSALARKLGMSVVFMGARQERRGCYKIHYVEICRDASKLTNEEIMNEYYRLLQKDIEACPTLYLWSHRRWKNLR